MHWMLMPLRRYAQFTGRSRRMEYWMFLLLNLIVGLVIFMLLASGGVSMAALADPTQVGAAFAGGIATIALLLAMVWSLAILIPSIAVSVRRLHDRGLSGWWYLGVIVASFIPLVGFVASIAFLVVMALPGTTGPNRFGPDPKGGVPGDTFA